MAIFITSVSLVGILGLVSSSLEAASHSKMKLIASSLAQESIEVVRDMRKAEIEWSNWYSLVVSGDYRVQYDSVSLISFSETPLNFDSNTGLYQYDSGDSSPFSRKVSLTKVSANEVKIVVEMKWLEKSTWRYLTIEDKLWDWK